MATQATPALEAAVRSVAAQDHRPLDIILFGNGAPLPPVESGFADVPVRYGHADRNLGVAGGRNAAARLAGGDVLLFVDDDAVLEPDAVGAGVKALASDPSAGAIAFDVRDPDTGRPALWYHPYDAREWSGRPFEAVSVIGCGHLVRRPLFEELGGFWDGYFRELEEIDLSWRLIDHGWKVLYEPRSTVLHAERTKLHLRYAIASHLKMRWRLMPAPLALRQSLFLLTLLGARALRHGVAPELAAGVRDAVRDAARVWRERETLRPATVEYLRRAHAPQSLGKRLEWSLRPLDPPQPIGGQPATAPAQPTPAA